MGHQCFAAQWGCGRTELPQPGERVWFGKVFELMGTEQKLLPTSLRLACFYLDTDPVTSPSQSWHCLLFCIHISILGNLVCLCWSTQKSSWEARRNWSKGVCALFSFNRRGVFHKLPLVKGERIATV